MHFSKALALISSAALVAAAPAPIMIGEDDVILYGEGGRFQIMKRSDLEEVEKIRNGILPMPPKPSYLDDTLITRPGNATRESDAVLEKRATRLIIPGPTDRFLGWDVLTSQVVLGSPTTIFVASGVSITNSISVSQGASFSLIKDYLEASFSIDYSTSWMTTQTQQFSVVVPEGLYGAFVTNAWTNRATGNIWEGSIGGEGTLTRYQADSFENRTYGDMSWVNGVVKLCKGETYPLPRCIGEGTL